ncbi:terpene synthase [Chitinophaga caeni]|uniref:Terpene synthase n=1 Tax=Chitinophaga caeni TaxID=2029983 RepID=A0A291QVZ9_9BACT|nr:terpene synthase [Chitinophaga caeni]ATL48052.1 terpene synthase [Chitinophaga caeni]
MSSIISHEALVAKLKHLPQPKYPWPNSIHPNFLEARQSYYAWIDRDYKFQSESARKKHKSHNLTDLAARGFPYLRTLEELRPVASYAANGAMMDDYFDRCSRQEMLGIVQHIMALLKGEETEEPINNGFLRQWWVLRQDALQCDIPASIYRRFIDTIADTFNGYAEEKAYYAANIIPPLAVYTLIREATSGAVPFCKYVCMQKDYRRLPDAILNHPHLLRIEVICALLIGMHNDFISLPKELMRPGDTMNIVKVFQNEHKMPLEEAYMAALAHHDNYLKEFLVLQQHLPRFDDEWKNMVAEYVEDLGIMVSGVYAWHTNDTTRYVPGGYVEGEFGG